MDTLIDKMMTLSTAHISEETAYLLDDELTVTKWGLIAYEKSAYGWFINLGFDELFNVPLDLLHCINYALENGCSWLCLDRDGDEADDLPTYDW